MTVLNIAPFIEAESDRIIGDDLIAGPQTYTVARVEGMVDEKKKKRLVLHLEGSGKPFIPCKGMARLLGHLWGPDAAKWEGLSMVLYRDPDVRFGADMTGGVRICAVSNIDKAVKVPIRTSQKSVKAYDVEPLKNTPNPDPSGHEQARAKAEVWVKEHSEAVEGCDSLAALDALIAKGKGAVAKLDRDHKDLRDMVMDVYSAKGEALEAETQRHADALDAAPEAQTDSAFGEGD